MGMGRGVRLFCELFHKYRDNLQVQFYLEINFSKCDCCRRKKGRYQILSCGQCSKGTSKNAWSYRKSWRRSSKNATTPRTSWRRSSKNATTRMRRRRWMACIDALNSVRKVLWKRVLLKLKATTCSNGVGKPTPGLQLFPCPVSLSLFAFHWFSR